MLGRRTELWVAGGFLTLALVALFVWIPNDTGSEPFYTFRRRTYVGDSLLPYVAAAGIAICALVQLISAAFRAKKGEAVPPIDGQTLRFVVTVSLILTGAILLMQVSGPIALSLFGEEGVTYRVMRATPPWKYVGYMVGGTALVFAMTSFAEGRVRASRLLYALLAAAALVLVFDVPFKNILLPPNGDF